MYGKWQWWWGVELHYPEAEASWKMYGLYIMGCSFLGYSKLIMHD